MAITSYVVPNGNTPLFFNSALLGVDNTIQGSWSETSLGYNSCWALTNTSVTDGDSYSQDIWVPGGIYSIKFSTLKRSNMGYITMLIDDVQIYNALLYISSGTYSPTAPVISNVVLSPGKHTIKFVANAYSTAKSIYVYDIVLYPSSTNYTAGRTFPYDPYACLSPVEIIPFWSNSPTVIQGTYAFLINNLYIHWLRVVNGNANNDEIHMKIALTSGIYDIRAQDYASTNYGILKGYLDDELIFTRDQYSSPSTNSIVTYATDITIIKPKIYTLKLKVDGKNASSTGYYMSCNALLFKRKS